MSKYRQYYVKTAKQSRESNERPRAVLVEDQEKVVLAVDMEMYFEWLELNLPRETVADIKKVYSRDTMVECLERFGIAFVFPTTWDLDPAKEI